MTELSPPARAVLDAIEADLDLPSWDVMHRVADIAASALRAAANQDETLLDINDELVPAVRAVRTDHLLAIAAELEAH